MDLRTVNHSTIAVVELMHTVGRQDYDFLLQMVPDGRALFYRLKLSAFR
ncbi:hypothetical protein [Microvirga brassicacearum]|nr:hypothetical protein [Microvirga brassicacearum]